MLSGETKRRIFSIVFSLFACEVWAIFFTLRLLGSTEKCNFYKDFDCTHSGTTERKSISVQRA